MKPNNENQNTKRGDNKILSFRQDIDFYLTRAEKELDRNDLLAATERYRRAYMSDPTDLDACLALADMLGRMQRYEESNRLLLVDMSMNDPDAESFFGLACNYYGMQEFDYARESLETYLAMEPEGTYAADAEEFLEVLNDEGELRYSIGLENESSETLTVTAKARRLTDCGQAEEAAKLLTEYLAQYPDAHRATHTLATIRFMQGDIPEALRLVESIIRKDRFHVCARCSKVLFLRANKQRAEADLEMEAILSLKVEFGPEELGAVGLLQMDAEQWDQAKDTMEKLAEFLPYDPLVLHHLATARYMLGDSNGALECYVKLLRIDPDDTVAQYYRTYLKKNPQPKRRHAFPAAYQVPLPEILHRLHTVTQALSLSTAAFRERWSKERAFRNLLAWSLSLPEEKYCVELLQLIASAADGDAERILRDFLLRTDRSDGLKHITVTLIGELNPHRDVMLYFGGEWIRGEVNEFMTSRKVPAAYEQMLGLLMQSVTERHGSKECVAQIGTVMQTIFAHYRGDLPRMTKERARATAAALEYLGHTMAGEPCDAEELATYYRVTPRRLQNAVSRIQYILNADEEEK